MDRTGLIERFQGALEHQGFIIQIFNNSFQVQIKIFYEEFLALSTTSQKNKNVTGKEMERILRQIQVYKHVTYLNHVFVVVENRSVKTRI